MKGAYTAFSYSHICTIKRHVAAYADTDTIAAHVMDLGCVGVSLACQCTQRNAERMPIKCASTLL
jgi:hypothetical protein